MKNPVLSHFLSHPQNDPRNFSETEHATFLKRFYFCNISNKVAWINFSVAWINFSVAWIILGKCDKKLSHCDSFVTKCCVDKTLQFQRKVLAVTVVTVFLNPSI